MRHSGWESVIQWAVWFTIMGLVMARLGRARLKPRPPSEAGTLAHPPSTLAIGAATTLLFGAIALITAAYGKTRADDLAFAIFAGLALLGLPLIAEYYHARHSVSPAGLEYGSLTGARGSMSWADVTHLRYANTLKWFRIEDAQGNVARLSIMLTGLPEFAAQALQHVPPHAMDAPTRAVLERTAAGNPPPVW